MMTSNLSNNFLGTLPKQYCIYFYVLCVIALIVLMFSVIGFFYLFTLKNVDYLTFVSALAVIINYFFSYIAYRLLYSMCVSSLK
jgi:hypothetical protein